MQELRQEALSCLAECQLIHKTSAVTALYQSLQLGALELDAERELVSSQPIPGRPERPVLVSPLLTNLRNTAAAYLQSAKLHPELD